MKSQACGTWKSPFTTDYILQTTIGLGGLVVDGDKLYWSEMHPQEKGRYNIITTVDGSSVDKLPKDFNARTRVHEYGGAPYFVHNETIYFSNFSDQRLYRLDKNSKPLALTPEDSMRYSNGSFDEQRNRIICVREDHSKDGEVINEIVAINNDATGTYTLVTGADFYAYPTLSPDGTQLAWMQWNHPNLPWNTSSIWIATVDQSGHIVDPKPVCNEKDVSVGKPSFSPDGTLFYVSDQTNWWNLYSYANGESTAASPMGMECTEPLWNFGVSLYDFVDEGTIIAAPIKNGESQFGIIDCTTNQFTSIDCEYTDISSITVAGDFVYFMGSSPTRLSEIVQYSLTSGNFTVIKKSSEDVPDASYISNPELIEYPTERGLNAFAFYYPPVNADFQPESSEKPPLIVMSHGGPTSATTSALSYKIQYWTSRGFAVVDVNYGGSTGYGREYRERLNGMWGIVDVEDCKNAAKFLAQRGDIDEQKIAIRGGSAGGYTTLCSLTFTDFYKAGASHFGISDLFALDEETHKFESEYTYKLVGKLPEAKDTYTERSPIFHCEKLNCPVIFLQGAEDKIVLPNQAELMVEKLKQKGIPVAYICYEGEQHGFRQSKNIKHALESELYFYSKVFNFVPADDLEPVEIDNL